MSPDKKTGQPMIFHQFWNSFWLLLVDSLILLSMLYMGDLIVYCLHGVPISLHYSLLLLPAWCTASVVTGQAPGWGLGAVEELRRIQLLLLALFAAAGIAAFLLGGMTSRIVFLSSYMASAFLIPFGRMACRKFLGRGGNWGCGVVLYGDPSTLERMIQVFGTQTNIGYHPIGIFSDELKGKDDFMGYPVLGGLQDVHPGASGAVASIAHLREKNLVEFIDHTLSGYRKVVLLPDLNKGVFAWVVPRDFNGLVGLELSRNLLNPVAVWLKRVYETVLVLLSLPIWLPLILLLALMVFLGDRKYPFYRQTRVGRKGRLIRTVKLRTMVPDADEALASVLSSDTGLQDEWDEYYKLKNDPRVTLIGRFLRRFSLDELPQLFSVLKGGMALVGPRPLPLYHQKELSEKSRQLRERVRPGLTGQWQVSGRSDCGIEEMEQMDSFYVRNWSVWIDIYIISRTLRVVLFSHGAY